ncbi:MAG: GNAT family N-acetyltransferase, partial [Eubacteriales bacterium]|nr:GNAT family N-acetyltransferase [Eubacteriales bacterium]
MEIRKATEADIPAVTAIYDALLDREEQGLLTTGWTRGVYPTEQTARDSLAAGTLYVLEDGGRVTAAAKIDQSQMAQYTQCHWQHDAPPEQVLVLHTLVVDPAVKGKG